MDQANKGGLMSYGAFRDQVEAGNITRVSFQRTEIRGRFKRSLDGAPRPARRSLSASSGGRVEGRKNWDPPCPCQLME